MAESRDDKPEQCPLRYRVAMQRQEPFEVTYRCGRTAGHEGACGADDGVPFVLPADPVMPSHGGQSTELDDVLAWADGVRGVLGTEHAGKVTAREARIAAAIAEAFAPSSTGEHPDSIALQAWQSAFGTTQLTHAKARLEVAEAKCAQSATTRREIVEECAALAAKKSEYFAPEDPDDAEYWRGYAKGREEAAQEILSSATESNAKENKHG